MNSQEAKKINLPDLMARLGYQPAAIRKNGNEYWYNSPFRNEKDASFHTSFLGGKWIWNDFGDKGGTVIDFVMRHENYLKVADALQFLDRFSGSVKTGNHNPFSSQQRRREFAPGANSETEKDLEFISAKKIQNPLIINYLTKERGIDKNLVLRYLEEVQYKNLNKQRTYFAFGIKNQSDGYEIRVASDKYPFKSALIKKDISLIGGVNPNRKIVNLFEGMTDFLSLLSMMKTQQLTGDSIILHSTKLLEKAIAQIEQQQYQSINGFLDNDKSGHQASEALKAKFGDLFFDQRELFQPYKDLNEFLTNELRSPQKTKSFGR